jgi:hypothetical protein
MPVTHEGEPIPPSTDRRKARGVVAARQAGNCVQEKKASIEAWREVPDPSEM